MLTINTKLLTRILKYNPTIKYHPLYSFTTGKHRDKRPFDVNYEKNVNPKHNNLNKEERQDRRKGVQSKQQEYANKTTPFKKQHHHHQKFASHKKSAKFLGSKISESSKVKQIVEKCKLSQLVEELKSHKEQELAKYLALGMQSITTVEPLINLLIQASLKLNLSQNKPVILEITNFVVNETPKKMSFAQPFFELQTYTQFIKKYQEALIEFFEQKFYSFPLYMNFYIAYLLNKSHTEDLRKFLFKRILEEMKKSDLSERQNFEVLRQYLMKVEDQKAHEQKRMFDHILSDQLMFFEPQILKRLLMIIHASKAGFYFSNHQISNIIEIMSLYCQDFIASSSLDQIIKITLSLSKMRNKTPTMNQKHLQLQNLYFKTILTHYFNGEARKPGELSRFIILFAPKVDLSQSEQPPLAQFILSHFQKEIHSFKDKSQLITVTFSKINEALKSIIFKDLFNYNTCKKQFDKFFENINPIVQSAVQTQQTKQLIYIKENISYLEQLQEFRKIDKTKRGNPKKIYSMLQKAVEREDIKWIEDIIYIMLQLKGNFSHLQNLQNNETLFQNTNTFNSAMNVLFQKNGLKILKKIFYNIFISKDKQINKIKNIFNTMVTWPQCQTQLIWQMFYAAWFEALMYERRPTVELFHIFIEMMIWKHRKFPKYQDHLSNPLFYQILNIIQTFSRLEKQVLKFQLTFYRLLCKVISRQHHSVLLDSYLVPFIKEFKIKQELFNEQNQQLKNRLQSHIMLYKMKGFVSEQQISQIYQKVLQVQRGYTERENMLITQTYSFYNENKTQLPSIQQRLLSIVAINNLSKLKQLQVELTQSSKVSIKTDLIFNFTPKQLISMLLSPLFEVDLLKYGWQVFLSRADLQFQFLDWKTLLEKYHSQELFVEQTINLTKKILQYYSKHFNILILQDLRVLHNVSKCFKARINEKSVEKYLRDSIKYFLEQRSLDNQKLDEILAFAYQIELGLNQQIANTVMQIKFKKRGSCMYLFVLEAILNQQEYTNFLKTYFYTRLTHYTRQIPLEVELYFKKNYPQCIQPYLNKINNVTNSKRETFDDSQSIRNKLIQIQKTYEDVYVNLTYNFILTGERILLFTDKIHEKVYPKIFEKIAEFIPEAAQKSIEIIPVNERLLDIQSLEKKYAWIKKSVKVAATIQNQPDIKNLEFQMKLAQDIADLQSRKGNSTKTQKKAEFSTKQDRQQI